MSKDEADSGEDVQKVLWQIVVRTSPGRYSLEGFNEFPDYWEELLEYLGEK